MKLLKKDFDLMNEVRIVLKDNVIVSYEGIPFLFNNDSKLRREISIYELRNIILTSLSKRYVSISGSRTKDILEHILSYTNDRNAIKLFEPELDKIVFKDYIYDINKKKKKSIQKTNYITSTIPFKYEDINNAGQPKKRLKFLNRMLCEYENKKGIIDTLQQYLGYCLIGNCNAHVMLILVGSGGNGKGVFTKVLKKIYGNRAINITLTNNPSPNMLIKLAGKTVAFDDDLDEIQIDKSEIKKLASGEAITGRKLYKNEVTFNNTAKLILSTNVEPYIKHYDNSAKRRLIMIKCEGRVDKQIPNLHEILYNEEGEAILRWCLEGLLKLHKNNFLINIDKQIIEGVEEYIKQFDTVYEFLKYKNDLGEVGLQYECKSTELYNEYAERYKTNKGYRIPSQRYFGTKIKGDNCKEFNIAKEKTRYGYIYKGIMV